MRMGSQVQVRRQLLCTKNIYQKINLPADPQMITEAAATESRGNMIWKQLHRRIMSVAKRRMEEEDGGYEQSSEDENSISHDPVFLYYIYYLPYTILPLILKFSESSP